MSGIAVICLYYIMCLSCLVCITDVSSLSGLCHAVPYVQFVTAPDTANEEFAAPHFPFIVYKDPKMHKMLLDVALGGAQAFRQAKLADRMSQHVLLRIDVALTRQGNEVRAW